MILVGVPEAPPAALLPQQGEEVRFRLLLWIDGHTGCARVEEACLTERPHKVASILRTLACGTHDGPEPSGSTQR